MIKDKKAKADNLLDKYLNLRSDGQLEESLIIEKQYAALRIEIIDEVTQEVNSRKSLTMEELERIVDSTPKKPKLKTGIYSLDAELTTPIEYEKEDGTLLLLDGEQGFSLGNFIQVAGAKYAGKTTLMMKIMTHFSHTEPVSWFDFEMGREKAVSTSRHFKRNVQNINYYDGGREINDIIAEIKFLYADEVRHFVIDSMMKLNAKGHKRGYEAASYISSVLSELTSSLGINIYMINQLSQDSLRNGDLFLKHGNDIEYDSDYLFFIRRKVIGKNEHGGSMYDESMRLITCTKNRVDNKTFTVEIPKDEIL